MTVHPLQLPLWFLYLILWSKAVKLFGTACRPTNNSKLQQLFFLFFLFWRLCLFIAGFRYPEYVNLSQNSGKNQMFFTEACVYYTVFFFKPHLKMLFPTNQCRQLHSPPEGHVTAHHRMIAFIQKWKSIIKLVLNGILGPYQDFLTRQQHRAKRLLCFFHLSLSLKSHTAWQLCP